MKQFILKIFNFVGANSLSDRDAITLTRAARNQIRQELQIQLVAIYAQLSDPVPELDGFVKKPEKYHAIFDKVKSFGHAPNELNLAILCPIHADGQKYVSGGSSGVGMVGNPDCTAIVSASIQSKNLVVLAILHELGHLFGAHHVTDSSIMNANVTALGKYPLHYSEKSKEEIKAFINA